MYRHPKQGLLFFGIRPDMTVVEVWPSGGWWTEILAPLLKERGKYYAAWYATQAAGASDYAKEQEKKFDAKLAERPDLYGRVIKTHLLAPAFVDMAPKGSADLVLTFRNVHNWAKAGNAEAMFKSFYDVLKPGGILGVVDHRAKPGTVFQRQIESGYLTEEYVIGLAEGGRVPTRGEVRAQRQSKGHRRSPEGRVDAAAYARAWRSRPRQVSRHWRVGPHDAEVRQAGSVVQMPAPGC